MGGGGGWWIFVGGGGLYLWVVVAGCPWVWWGFVEGFELFFSSLLRFLNLEFVRVSVIVVVVCGGGFWLVVTATWLFGSIWIGFE